MVHKVEDTLDNICSPYAQSCRSFYNVKTKPHIYLTMIVDDFETSYIILLLIFALKNWRNKRLTLIGKIAVIKALAASQFVYVVSLTPPCSKSLKETNDLLLKFLCDNKGDKIKRTEMIADYQDEEQKMPDIIIEFFKL